MEYLKVIVLAILANAIWQLLWLHIGDKELLRDLYLPFLVCIYLLLIVIVDYLIKKIIFPCRREILKSGLFEATTAFGS
jgi:hypothetical protein